MQHHPTEIALRQRSRTLAVAFDDGTRYELSFEYLRVFSPSAEVSGHGPGQETLQVGKKDVVVQTVEPVGSYAVRLVFNDGHNTGIYSWDVLHDLGANYERNWRTYLQRLEDAGASREPSL